MSSHLFHSHNIMEMLIKSSSTALNVGAVMTETSLRNTLAIKQMHVSVTGDDLMNTYEVLYGLYVCNLRVEQISPRGR